MVLAVRRAADTASHFQSATLTAKADSLQTITEHPIQSMARFLAHFLNIVLISVLVPAGARAEIAFQPDDTVLFYGNSMVERLGEQGELEALIQLAHPDQKLHFRSLAWTGDEVGYRLRPEGYEEYMKLLLKEWPAKVVIVGFGMNEAFEGAAGLADFRTQLGGYLNQIVRLHPDAKLVLLSPTAVERGGQVPDVDVRNRDVVAYAQVIGEAAKARGAMFVDLLAASRDAYAKGQRLTTNGLHLNGAGNHGMAQVIARALLGDAAVEKVDPARVPELAKAVARKAYYVAEIVRPKNADLYYGIRRRPEEFAAEIPRYHQMIAATEAVVHELAASPGKNFADIPLPWLPPQDRTLVLEDTDHDGKADQCTTFAEGLDALDGVEFTEFGVIVSEQPKLWLMADTNGDGRADTRELFRGIDVTDSHWRNDRDRSHRPRAVLRWRLPPLDAGDAIRRGARHRCDDLPAEPAHRAGRDRVAKQHAEPVENDL